VKLTNGFAGQESDISQACAAFGLDTLNYRAFPNAGPLPEAFARPAAAAPQPQPAPAQTIPAPQPYAAPQGGSAAPYFPLLAQAIPTAAAKPAASSAFAMARSPLHAPAAVEKLAQTPPPAINPSAFGAAFAAAYTAAFGHGAPQPVAAFPPPFRRA
jgi:hypothetical protein